MFVENKNIGKTRGRAKKIGSI